MKILNFGSLNLDYVYTVDHFVQPGETLSSLDYKINAGGKGLNQSIALARAGANVYHAGCIGKEGAMLRDLLDENGVDTRFLKQLDCSCGHAVIQVDKSGQNCIILYSGTNRQITDEQIEQVFNEFSSDDILVIQNEINSLEKIINAASRRGMRIAFNPSPFEKKLLDLPLDKITWFLVNEIEGKELSNGKTEPKEIINSILSQYPNSRVVLTLGADGVMYGDRESIVSHPAHEASVVDTTAAGDTFTGYFIKAVSENIPVEKALQTASAASAITISRQGAAQTIPFAHELAK